LAVTQEATKGSSEESTKIVVTRPISGKKREGAVETIDVFLFYVS